MQVEDPKRGVEIVTVDGATRWTDNRVGNMVQIAVRKRVCGMKGTALRCPFPRKAAETSGFMFTVGVAKLTGCKKRKENCKVNKKRRGP